MLPGVYFSLMEKSIWAAVRDAMAGALDLRSDTVVEGANHYTMLLWPEYVRIWAPEVFEPPFWER